VKLSVSITLNPENQEESKNPTAYQNISYSLIGFNPKIKLDELNEIVHDWIKSQQKKK
jgi:hypothetical protein